MRRPRPHSPQHDRDYGGNCREGSGGYSRRGRIEKRRRRHSWRVLNGSPLFFLGLNRPRTLAAVAFVDFVDCADVGMVQSGSGFGLTLETAESLGIFSYIVREELQGNEAAQFDVFSLLRD